ncbi:hypothetical protein HPB50_020607 [Hyalomma asiaticum]|uniref:Uncharacterized protein n=1 Tax=Hyalomma asiaticum TaxID=266040 RepID=A0ACB7S4P9_HYAAI|nr:hypothetical protein HPB50_020607 [Hyalomma asiaticum]
MLWRVLPSEKRSYSRERQPPAVTGAGAARREPPSEERCCEDDVASPDTKSSRRPFGSLFWRLCFLTGAREHSGFPCAPTDAVSSSGAPRQQRRSCIHSRLRATPLFVVMSEPTVARRVSPSSIPRKTRDPAVVAEERFDAVSNLGYCCCRPLHVAQRQPAVLGFPR